MKTANIAQLLHCLYKSEQIMNLAVIAQFIIRLPLNYLYNHKTSSYYIIHKLPLSVQTIKSAVIFMMNVAVASITQFHETRSYYTIDIIILPLSVQKP